MSIEIRVHVNAPRKTGKLREGTTFTPGDNVTVQGDMVTGPGPLLDLWALNGILDIVDDGDPTGVDADVTNHRQRLGAKHNAEQLVAQEEHFT